MKTPDTINGKTPEEIKKGMECCGKGSCLGCPYRKEEHCITKKNDDVNAYIQQLESLLTQAERERDAAVADLSNGCAYCKYAELGFKDSPCDDCLQRGGKHPWSPMKRTKFEWRGVCPENTKEDAE